MFHMVERCFEMDVVLKKHGNKTLSLNSKVEGFVQRLAYNKALPRN